MTFGGQIPTPNFILGKIPTTNFILGKIPTSQILGQIPTFLGSNSCVSFRISEDNSFQLDTLQ